MNRKCKYCGMPGGHVHSTMPCPMVKIKKVCPKCRGRGIIKEHPRG